MIMLSMHQKDITVLNMQAPTKMLQNISKYIWKKSQRRNIVVDFNTFSLASGTNRKSLVYKIWAVLSNSFDKLHLYGTPHNRIICLFFKSKGNIDQGKPHPGP